MIAPVQGTSLVIFLLFNMSFPCICPITGKNDRMNLGTQMTLSMSDLGLTPFLF